MCAMHETLSHAIFTCICEPYAPSFSEPHDTREERERSETDHNIIDMKLNPVYGIHTPNMCTSTCSEDHLPTNVTL